MAVKPPDGESLNDAQILVVMWCRLKTTINVLGTQGIIPQTLADSMTEALDLFKPPTLFQDARK